MFCYSSELCCVSGRNLLRIHDRCLLRLLALRGHGCGPMVHVWVGSKSARSWCDSGLRIPRRLLDRRDDARLIDSVFYAQEQASIVCQEVSRCGGLCSFLVRMPQDAQDVLPVGVQEIKLWKVVLRVKATQQARAFSRRRGCLFVGGRRRSHRRCSLHAKRACAVNAESRPCEFTPTPTRKLAPRARTHATGSRAHHVAAQLEIHHAAQG
mmetsp:Transcript_55021/g.128704  ORF Transcript_55021/g.128704 Transcript_55021/m.128704 type:complete len:210 (+) Transcript_55021:1063-1692(+)